jgi:hypothetical protein
MRVLFDIVHPTHVHFYRHMIAALTQAGDEVLVVARDKDVTLDLLADFEIPHENHGTGGTTSWFGQGRELLGRDLHLIRACRRFRPDVVVTRNPAGTHAAWLLRIPSVFDTDNGLAGGIHHRAGAPFATVITAAECLSDDLGPKRRSYPGYKPMAYLHPDVFTPDPSVLGALGVDDDTPFAILRLVAMAASHDHGERGMPLDVARRLIGEIAERLGPVFVSTEGPLPDEFEALRFPASPGSMLDAIAYSSLVLGDSASMAAEAAVLGRPNIFYSSFARRLDYMNDLEDRYGLSRNLQPEQVDELFASVARIVDDPGRLDTWAARRQRMLSETTNVVDWYVDLIREVAAR